MCYLDNSIYTAPCIFKNSVQSLGFVITYGEHDSWLEMEKYTLRKLQGKFLNKHTQFLHVHGKIVHKIQFLHIQGKILHTIQSFYNSHC